MLLDRLPMSYQLLILIPLTVEIQSFDEGWPEFLKTAEKMPGLIQESVNRIDNIIYGQNHLRRIYSFSFKDRSSLEQALLSPDGEKAGKLLHKITKGNMILLGGDYKQDSLKDFNEVSS
jgi:hypothetical protein